MYMCLHISIDWKEPSRVAQYVKRWSAGLAVPGSSPAGSRNLPTVNGVPLYSQSS